VHVTVIELLRCPAGHAESSLVASATRQIERRIIDGSLGCPVCGAEYPIAGGVADLRIAPATVAKNQSALQAAAPNEDATIRLAAQLDLIEHGRLVLLAGEYATMAPSLSVMFDAVCIALGVPQHAERHVAEHASVLRVDAIVPLAQASLHGAAIDGAHSSQFGLTQVSALLKPRGRLVASASTNLPLEVSELARDEREWVAARTARSSDVVPLRRAPR
jgi:uncharacterized protein YbaR (Trm112 family)